MYQTITTNMTMSKCLKWSVLDPRPVLWYDEKLQQWFAAWNNIVMTAEHALMISSGFYWGIFPTPEMKKKANDRMIQLINLGALEPLVYGPYPPKKSLLQYYESKITPHLKHTLPRNKIKAEEVYQWFDKFLKC